MMMRRLLQLLTILALGHGVPSLPAETNPSIFQTPLRFNGSQWQVESLIGPIFLARQENGSWRSLTVFDGTNGKYFLNWQHPVQGLYVAMDSQGTRSAPVQIGESANPSSAADAHYHSCNLPNCAWSR